MIASRFMAFVLCFLAAGCGKAKENPADPSPTPTARTDKLKEELDVPQLLRKGGKHWSSLETFSIAGEDFNAGEHIWIWPLEDKVWHPKEEELVIQLGWKKRGDESESLAKTIVGAEAAGASPSTSFRTYAPVTGFDVAADQGRVEARFRFRQKGDGDVLVYLVAGGKKAASNLLRLTVKSAP